MLLRSGLLVLSLFAAAGRMTGLSPVAPGDAPRATPQLLRTLSASDGPVAVLVGLKDGTPSARWLRENPDPAGEKVRQIARIEAQQTLADTMPADQFQPRHFYESFSILAGTASRQGAIALARRPDVAWVALDGTKHLLQATPQSAQVLIKSDRANALGVNGAGKTIAVIDTGVDYTVPDLGGGTFPNSKVIGGTDVADRDSDPIDCDGHGTSVAAIAAGPTGVAPGAKIVAIKVFSSANSCNEALDSDILQGVNYAITNRALFGITAVNLSLGSEPDHTDAGYCDNFEPSYAEAFDLATSSGIVVVVASGNGGRTGALADPACISSAISVGAVYSSTRTRVAWSPPDACTDSPATVDHVVCFSDSATSLSLLAPGAFWNVVTKGGTFDSGFAGTSASAPAVSGAVALVAQARPDLTPAGIVGLLRATGTPITDPRNGIVTPRIDALAAVQLAASKFAPYTGSSVLIPDGSAAATVSTTISGFTGAVGTVQVWVQIDHPEPSQLRLTLIGPDGTTALLSNLTGKSDQPINAFYGLTDAAVQSLDRFAGKPGNGVWTLRVEDTVGGTAGRIRSFGVRLVTAVAPCVPNSTTLCLNSGRFQVRVAWLVPSTGASGVGTAVPLTADTGYFWFFTANNVELVLKVVDGRPVNGKFWVFYGALTDVQYTVTITDSLTGEVKSYVTPSGTPTSRADTSAF
ncbi:MAG: S8 family serine peptidase [Acidobacteriota bacterium]